MELFKRTIYKDAEMDLFTVGKFCRNFFRNGKESFSTQKKFALHQGVAWILPEFLRNKKESIEM